MLYSLSYGRVGRKSSSAGVAAPLLLLLAAAVLPWAAPRHVQAAETRTVPAAAPLVQSLLLRAVTVTHDLPRSLVFYRDVLGQELVELNRLDTARSQRWLSIGARAEVWFAVLRGRGEYAGGPLAGGRIAFIGIVDPDATPADRQPARGRKGAQGDVILPHRVSNLDTIMARIREHGFEVLLPPSTSSTGLSRSAMVFDPNGHIVELFELHTPPATPPATEPARLTPADPAPKG